MQQQRQATSEKAVFSPVEEEEEDMVADEQKSRMRQNLTREEDDDEKSSSSSSTSLCASRMSSSRNLDVRTQSCSSSDKKMIMMMTTMAGLLVAVEEGDDQKRRQQPLDTHITSTNNRKEVERNDDAQEEEEEEIEVAVDDSSSPSSATKQQQQQQQQQQQEQRKDSLSIIKESEINNSNDDDINATTKPKKDHHQQQKQQELRLKKKKSFAHIILASSSPRSADMTLEDEEEESSGIDDDRNGNENKIATKATSQQQQHVIHNSITKKTSYQRFYHQSKLIYKQSAVCLPIRCLCMKFPRQYPRMFSLIFGIVLPLWFLIMLGFGFGILLAQTELQSEITSNDKIVRARTLLSKFDQADDLLLDLPTYCLEEYYETHLGTAIDDTSNNNSNDDENLNSSAIVDGIFNDLSTFLDTFDDQEENEEIPDNDNNTMIELECDIFGSNVTVCDCSGLATTGYFNSFDEENNSTDWNITVDARNITIDGGNITFDGNFTIDYPLTIDGNITICDLDCNNNTTTSGNLTTFCECRNITTINSITIDGSSTLCDFVGNIITADDDTTVNIPDYESVLQETESILNQTGSMVQEELNKAYARIEQNAKMRSYENIHKFVTSCKEDFLGPYHIAEEMQKNLSLAYSDLSFIWVRCWPEEFLGQVWMEFWPTDEVVSASQPSNQEDTFIQEWTNVQEILYEEYIKGLGPNATNKELYAAYLKSLDDATGGEACMENIGGTSWFFFTVMTTIGYGNQSPSTPEGRLLLYTAGLVSLIMFGIILSTSGHILTAIFDDFVSRFRISKFLKKPLVGAIVWGSLWFSFLLMIADHAQWFWEARAGEIVERKDAVWFAYISTTTVGLGDYFLQPEVMFGIDTLQFSVTLLVGLVFLADFFGKVSDLVVMILPRRQNSLEARLKATRLFVCMKNRPSSSSPTSDGSDSEIFNDDDDDDDDDDEIDVDMEELKDRIYALETLLPAREEDGLKGNNTNGRSGSEEEEHYADYRNLTPLELLEKEEEILQALALRAERKKDALLSAMDREVDFQRW